MLENIYIMKHIMKIFLLQMHASYTPPPKKKERTFYYTAGLVLLNHLKFIIITIIVLYL